MHGKCPAEPPRAARCTPRGTTWNARGTGAGTRAGVAPTRVCQWRPSSPPFDWETLPTEWCPPHYRPDGSSSASAPPPTNARPSEMSLRGSQAGPFLSLGGRGVHCGLGGTQRLRSGRGRIDMAGQPNTAYWKQGQQQQMHCTVEDGCDARVRCEQEAAAAESPSAACTRAPPARQALAAAAVAAAASRVGWADAHQGWPFAPSVKRGEGRVRKPFFLPHSGSAMPRRRRFHSSLVPASHGHAHPHLPPRGAFAWRHRGAGLRWVGGDADRPGCIPHSAQCQDSQTFAQF